MTSIGRWEFVSLAVMRLERTACVGIKTPVVKKYNKENNKLNYRYIYLI